MKISLKSTRSKILLCGFVGVLGGIIWNTLHVIACVLDFRDILNKGDSTTVEEVTGPLTTVLNSLGSSPSGAMILGIAGLILVLVAGLLFLVPKLKPTP